jgi:hypothetical protein
LRQLGLRHLFADHSDFRRGFGERIVALLVLGDVEKEPSFFEL